MVLVIQVAVKTDAIEGALENLNVNGTLIKWIVSMLKNRYINAGLGETLLRVTVSRCTLQGGDLSPLL